MKKEIFISHAQGDLSERPARLLPILFQAGFTGALRHRNQHSQPVFGRFSHSPVDFDAQVA
jgi:hypothetical protein